MEFNRQNIRSKATIAETHVIDEGLRAYMLKVYNYMASGVLLTGVISLFLFKLSVVTAADGSIIGLTDLGNALACPARSCYLYEFWNQKNECS